MKITKGTVLTLIELEKKYGLLTKDRMDQDNFFEMQDELTLAMIVASQGNITSMNKLVKELPYLFSNKPV